MTDVQYIERIVTMFRDRRVNVAVRVWTDVANSARYLADVRSTNNGGRLIYVLWDSVDTVQDALMQLHNVCYTRTDELVASLNFLNK
jgi:hypothetical protein